MENKVNMTCGRAYEAPDMQITEVLVEKGFQDLLGATCNLEELTYGDDLNEFE